MGSSVSSQAQAVAGAAAVIGIGLLACVVAVLSRSGGKTMKAPGRGDRIPRDHFARDPKAYFRDLRNKK
ncbi:hypothetical protein FH972_006490 [Carpinus fangiana]|uniref:Uncharacterized protein n=1 Tax=Carpinus fangiana TaxID=176857 RepID=A0A5N6QSF7_9ROSI|nr:hypothetical protein FH972_006490 [Carpinus fangiana]